MVDGKGVSKDILIMDPGDNVAVCLRDIKAGENVTFSVEAETISVNVLDHIPRGHKICVSEIPNDAKVVKYGEIIGKANTDIQIGQHVHVHNVVD